MYESLFILNDKDGILLHVTNEFPYMQYYMNKSINNTFLQLTKYGGNTHQYISDVKQMKLNYVKSDMIIGHYTLDDSFSFVKTNNNLPDLFKLDVKTHDIFIDPIICKLPINENDAENNAKGTETIINECTITEVEVNELVLKRDQEKLEIEKLREQIAKKKEREKRIKQQIKKDQENWESFVKKYIIDRKLYFVFKSENRTDIDVPLLFKLQWIVFGKMENENKLHIDITSYLQHTSELDDIHQNMVQAEIKMYNECVKNVEPDVPKDKYDGLFTFDDPFVDKLFESTKKDFESDSDCEY